MPIVILRRPANPGDGNEVSIRLPRGIIILDDTSMELKIQRLKTAKSGYILEADASLARGLDSAAMALFVKAAELELDLVGLFR